MIDSQVAAARTIDQVLRGRSLSALLEEADRRRSPRDVAERAVYRDICYGALRAYGMLDGILARALARPIQDRPVHALLVAALYQLRETAAAPWAIVDHAVRSATLLGFPAAGGLVNAVLRRYLRESEALEASAARLESARHSHPQWWIDKVRTQFPDRWTAILAEANRHAPLTLRVNRRRVEADAYASRLMESGLSVAWRDQAAIALERPVPVERLPGFSEGCVSVQDASAQLAAPLLGAAAGMRVLDACAAPGGKTAHLLELADIDLTAVDVDAARLGRVRANLARLGLHCEVIAGDVGRPADWWDGRPFDRVLVDAPCSASGIARRHPDIKWLRRGDDLDGLARAQAAVLEGAWQVLASGGTLLYATCSLFAEENRNVVTRFLQAHPDATEHAIVAACLENGQVIPDRFHDGFFYALIAKC